MKEGRSFDFTQGLCPWSGCFLCSVCCKPATHFKRPLGCHQLRKILSAHRLSVSLSSFSFLFLFPRCSFRVYSCRAVPRTSWQYSRVCDRHLWTLTAMDTHFWRYTFLVPSIKKDWNGETGISVAIDYRQSYCRHVVTDWLQSQWLAS